MDAARLELDGKQYDLPIVVGSEGERGSDISALRSTTGHITLDDGYGNTGSAGEAKPAGAGRPSLDRAG